MIIRLANKDDCLKIAKIHVQEIKHGFLSELGEKFLYYFYQAIINSSNTFLIVAENNNLVVGFVSGSTDLKKFYKEFFKKYGFKVFLILLRRILNIIIIKKVFETIKYSKKEDFLKAEFLSIAVLTNFQGLGIARKLLDKFISEMKKRNITKFKVIIGENLTRAIGFYEKNGFKFHSKSFVHKNMPSKIYIYNIENN